MTFQFHIDANIYAFVESIQNMTVKEISTVNWNLNEIDKIVNYLIFTEFRIISSVTR